MSNQALTKRLDEIERSLRPPRNIFFGIAADDETINEAAERVAKLNENKVSSYDDIFVIVKI
jgi:low affinity Fe/Cu permease